MVTGEFSKRKLLRAVKEGRLRRKELRKVLNEGTVKGQFFGDGNFVKDPKWCWDDIYQEEVYWLVHDEEFNPEGILHLEEVSRQSRKQGILKGIYRGVLLLTIVFMTAEFAIWMSLMLIA